MTDPVTLLKYLLPPLLAAPVMVWAYRNLRFAQQWRFLIKPLAILALVLSGLLSLRSIPLSTRDPWSPTRLAPIVSWTMGHPLYPSPGDGPVLIRMYGPVSSFVYTPAAIASTPTVATLIGAFIDVLLFALPALWFILRATRGLDREIILAAIAIFFVIAIQHPVLRHSASMVTVDAPAIGLATCAMAVLIGATNRVRAALLAGLFASLAIWSKQTLAPILPAIIIYLFLIAPSKQALKLSALAIGAVGAFSLLMLLLFGFGPLWFNLVIVPGNRNWQWPEPTTAAVMMRSLRTIAADSMPMGLMLVAAIFIRRDLRISRNPWLLPVMAAILVLPLSMIAYAQVGGFSNNGAPIHYFALLASVTALAVACGTDVPGSPLSATARVARLGMIALLVGGLVVQPGNWLSLADTGTAWGTIRENPNQVAYDYARAHPGEIWFPKQPLASLLAEGRVYHFDEGLYALKLAGVEMNDAWYTSGLPENLRYVGYRGEVIEGPMRPPPGFTQVVRTPDLPGWTLVRQAE